MTKIYFSSPTDSVNVFPCRNKYVAVIQKLKRSQLLASAVIAAESGHNLFCNSELHDIIVVDSEDK